MASRPASCDKFRVSLEFRATGQPFTSSLDHSVAECLYQEYKQDLGNVEIASKTVFDFFRGCRI